MRLPRELVLCCLLVTGCLSDGAGTARSSGPSFEPVAVRLHPVFTRLKDWTGDDKIDGIEAVLEFQDAVGDPTKASGQAIFELFQYKPRQPDPRGPRVASAWVGKLATWDDQAQRWNRASRAYTFPLESPLIDPRQSYVLTAQFDTPQGQRLFDRLVIEARPPAPDRRAKEEPVAPSTGRS